MPCQQEGDLVWNARTTTCDIESLFRLIDPQNWDTNVPFIFAATTPLPGTLTFPPGGWTGVMLEHVKVGALLDIKNHLKITYQWTSLPGTAPGTRSAFVSYEIAAHPPAPESDMPEDQGQLHLWESKDVNGQVLTHLWFSKAAVFPVGDKLPDYCSFLAWFMSSAVTVLAGCP